MVTVALAVTAHVMNSRDFFRSVRRFRDFPGTETDVRMTDLQLWHQLELEEPQLFGRMHYLFLERDEDMDAARSVRGDLASMLLHDNQLSFVGWWACSSTSSVTLNPSQVKAVADGSPKRQKLRHVPY
eukprot:6487634-Amphidinium_carterae.2